MKKILLNFLIEENKNINNNLILIIFQIKKILSKNKFIYVNNLVFEIVNYFHYD